MSSLPEYLTMHIFLTHCNSHDRTIIETWFRALFQNHKIGIKRTLNNDGLRLFIMLGLYYPLKGDICCMGRNKHDQRCKNKLDIGKLVINMYSLWDLARAGEIQGSELLEEIYHLCKEFLCEGQHRREVSGKVEVAEELAIAWYPVFEEFRRDTAPQQTQPAGAMAKGRGTGPEEMDTSW